MTRLLRFLGEKGFKTSKRGILLGILSGGKLKMSVKIGIPRALLFYKYAPLWMHFFKNLDLDVVVSPQTNKKILNDAIECCVDDACLPVKLYHGHVSSIKDKVDYLFIPRIMRVSQGRHICPKFGGIPEMIKYSLTDLPPIIDVEIDLQKGLRTLQAGKYFSKDPARIIAAYNKALVQFRAHEKKLDKDFSCWKNSNKLKVMVFGHPYNLYDSYINLNVLGKIELQGLSSCTTEMIGDELIESYAKTYDGKYLWTFAEKLIGAAKYLLAEENVDGIIYISSFGCGIDAVVGSTVERIVRRESQIPFMFLNLDEHTGEGGINTRLEAFIDLIKYRVTRLNSPVAYGGRLAKGDKVWHGLD
jgi:predicted nucleotide-binding protein (sugar kinase/HSP70/actin superfamily)